MPDTGPIPRPPAQPLPRRAFPRHLGTLVLAMTVLVSACTGVPERVTPVENFELGRYLGKWYEIARLDHSFERGLTHVSAEYSMREDGGVRVINRGYAPTRQAWKAAEGKARFVGTSDRGHLKVSFFGPFYGSYVVFGLDQTSYQYTLVSGPDTSYLWILARSPQLPREVVDALVEKAAAAGFDTGKLIFVDHQPPVPASPGDTGR